MPLPNKLLRITKRLLLPLGALVYILWAFLNLHTRNVLRNAIAQTPPYSGGPIDDIKLLRCYFWHGSCNQMIEKNLVAKEDGSQSWVEQTWFKVDKQVDLVHGESIHSWALYHEYLYVHPTSARKKFNVANKVIVDMALGEPGSSKAPYYVVKDQASPRLGNGRPKSRIDVQEADSHGWELRNGVFWVKYDKSTSKQTVWDVAVLFGEDVVEPRPEWALCPGTLALNVRHVSRISLRHSNQQQQPLVTPKLQESENGEFKILQLSDFHFTENLGKCRDQVIKESGCVASSKSLNFIFEVLDSERPQLAVITGDILDGFNTFDYQTAILKALSPLISRSIPFAVALGESDKSEYASRLDIVRFVASLPGSVMELTGNTLSEMTNFAIPVYNSKDEVINVIYIRDLYTSPADNPEDEPTAHLKHKHDMLPNEPKLSIQFQHFPIAEYRPKAAFSLVGAYNEKDKLKHAMDPLTRQFLSDVNVQAISVGAEHTNDCCIHDKGHPPAEGEKGLNPLWMCYAGSVGEGAYGNSKMERRVRLFRLDSQTEEITTWKRRQGQSNSVFDYQFIKEKKNSG